MVHLYSRVSRSLALPISKMPRFIIPLADKRDSSIGGMPATFLRNSTATYIDDSDLVKTAGIDVIRFQNDRYLCEPDGTNMLSYSELLTNVYWGGTGLSIAADAPTGMFKLTNTLTGSCHTKSGSLSFTSGIYYTQSAELMKGNTDFVSMTFASPVSSLLPYAIFNLATGIVTKAQNCTATMYPLASGAYRCTITVVATATVSILGGVITPCRENSLRAEGVVGDYIYANKIQTETGTQATSYIPTTSAPVTRAADVLHYAVGDVITQGQGSLYCEFYNEILNSGASRVLLCLSDGTSSNRLYFQINASNLLTFLVVTGGSTVGYLSGSGSSVIGLNKVLLTYADNNMRLYLNGAASGEDLSGVINTTLNKLSVGCLESGTAQANREIGNIKYFKEVLTGAEAIKLTTL